MEFTNTERKPIDNTCGEVIVKMWKKKQTLSEQRIDQFGTLIFNLNR